MEPLFLTEAELEDATGYKRPSAQARILARNGIPFMRRADGHLRVARAHIESPPSRTRTQTPDFEALQRLG